MDTRGHTRAPVHRDGHRHPRGIAGATPQGRQDTADAVRHRSTCCRTLARIPPSSRTSRVTIPAGDRTRRLDLRIIACAPERTIDDQCRNLARQYACTATHLYGKSFSSRRRPAMKKGWDFLPAPDRLSIAQAPESGPRNLADARLSRPGSPSANRGRHTWASLSTVQRPNRPHRSCKRCLRHPRSSFGQGVSPRSTAPQRRCGDTRPPRQRLRHSRPRRHPNARTEMPEPRLWSHRVASPVPNR